MNKLIPKNSLFFDYYTELYIYFSKCVHLLAICKYFTLEEFFIHRLEGNVMHFFFQNIAGKKYH